MEQLKKSELAYRLLAEEAKRSNNAAAAKRIGYSRSSVSLALAGKYPGGVGKLRDAILACLQTVECPHLGDQLSGDDCRAFQARDMPTANPQALAHWRACQICPHAQKKEATDAA